MELVNVKIDFINIKDKTIKGSYIITTDSKGNIKRIKYIPSENKSDLNIVIDYFMDLFDFLRNMYTIVGILPKKDLICFNRSIKGLNPKKTNLKNYQLVVNY